MVYNVNMDSMSLSYLTETRRKLHALAELSGSEYKTSDFIFSELLRFGYKPKRIDTGVYCDLGRGNKRLAFRADIDALPIKENVQATHCDFAAEGSAMHACGHDGHTANLLNIARLMQGKTDTPLRFIFQYGEEGIGGSLAMIEGGVLDGVDEIYALHLCPELEAGKIGYCYGGMFAGCVEFDCKIKGRAAHCAMPEKGANAVHASIDVAEAAFKAADRRGLLLNLGKITGGVARNVIAAECVSEYTVRFYDQAKSEAVMIDIERALLAADDRYGVEHRLEVLSTYPPLINHALAVDKARKAAGERAVEMPPRNTAEDFSNYLLETTGCMVWLGTGRDGMRSPLHSDTFAFDERDLLVGTELFMRLIDMRRGNKE